MNNIKLACSCEMGGRIITYVVGTLKIATQQTSGLTRTQMLEFIEHMDVCSFYGFSTSRCSDLKATEEYEAMNTTFMKFWEPIKEQVVRFIHEHY